MEGLAHLLGEVGSQDGHALLVVALLDDTQAGRSGELGPVGGTSEPLEVVAQEEVVGGAGLGEPVANDDRGIDHRAAGLHRRLTHTGKKRA